MISAAALTPGPAEALPAHLVDFEGAAVADGEIAAPGARFRPLAPAGLAPGVGGGALALQDLGTDGIGGASGLALSTRDLGFPYGFVVELETPAAAASGLWIAANAVWEVTGRGLDGGELLRAEIAPGAGGFALEAPSGLARLDFASLGGWDWVLLDDLALTPLEAAASAPPPVPAPTPLLLLTGALLALTLRRKRRPGPAAPFDRGPATEPGAPLARTRRPD